MRCPSCNAEADAAATACPACGASLLAPTSVVVSIDLSVGALFHGRYEIKGPLGRGGMGMVYRARDKTLDETVAIKVLRPDFAQDAKMAERFRSEIKLARRVRHKNVCAIHDYGEERGLLYISMELVEGVDLKHVLKERGPLPPSEAYDVGIQVAEGLQAVHDAGIIHRDLKTPNIMLDPQGVARLMDFGIAKRQGGGGASTATGHVLGTPEYMSPEQAQGKRVDFRSDVYALGIVIYEIFTGDVPFRGETPISTILKHLHDPPPVDSAKIPDSLRPVLRRALAKDPEARYPSSRAVAEALRDARSPSRRQQPVPTSVLQAPTLPRPQARPKRSRAMQAFLLAVPVLALGGGALMLVRGRGAGTPNAMPALPPATTSLAPATTAPITIPPSPVTEPTLPPATPRPRPAPSATPAAVRSVAPTLAAAPTSTLPAQTPAPTPPPPLEPGTLQIAVRPWAEVSVDGKLLGTTPLDRISLPPGPHVVSLRHPAYDVVARTVSVRSGEPTKLIVDLASEATKKPD